MFSDVSEKCTFPVLNVNKLGSDAKARRRRQNVHRNVGKIILQGLKSQKAII